MREWRPEDHGQPPGAEASDDRAAPSEAPRDPVSAQEAEARATLALWNVTCASCHGRDGRGGGPALPPGAKVPDLTDPAFQDARSDTELSAAIANGKGLMPALGSQLGTAGVDVLVSHVRRLRAGAQPPTDPANTPAVTP